MMGHFFHQRVFTMTTTDPRAQAIAKKILADLDIPHVREIIIQAVSRNTQSASVYDDDGERAKLVIQQTALMKDMLVSDPVILDRLSALVETASQLSTGRMIRPVGQVIPKSTFPGLFPQPPESEEETDWKVKHNLLLNSLQILITSSKG